MHGKWMNKWIKEREQKWKVTKKRNLWIKLTEYITLYKITINFVSPREIVSVTNPSFVIFLTAPWRRAFYKRQFIKRLRINKGISKSMLFYKIATRKVVFQMSSTWLKKTSLFFSFFPCHYVRPQLGFGRKWVNFVRPMSDDRLLFTALSLWTMHGRT